MDNDGKPWTFRALTVTPRASILDRMHSDRLRNEAAALDHAREEERQKWQLVITEKDAALSEKDAEIARLLSLLEGK